MTNNIHDIIRQRRSIYPLEFNGQVLDNSIVKQLLEDAHWAPNHYLNLPWHFLVLTGASMHNWLNKVLEIEQVKASSDPKKFNKIDVFKQKISHAIVIVQNTTDHPKAKAFEDALAIGAAVQNMYLGLSAYEHVGGYWSTGLCNNHADMKAHFNLSEQQQMLGYFIIGGVDQKRTASNRASVDAHIQFL